MPVAARPRKLGPYDVVVKIAGGGMATIYLGRKRDVAGEEQLVAIKVIRHELRQDRRIVQMFHDEAEILSRMAHPNITTTLECGWENEQHFIAMELMVGRNLADVWDTCKARRLTLRHDHAAWIAARVADALHHAHELRGEDGQRLNVVHRDVNPTNIFLTFDGEVKLFDFGLAKSTGSEAESSMGIVKGKLPYLSPEQVTEGPLDRRSDVYMLGTTLWEMTTMRRLFKRNDDVETLMAVRAGLVPDPRATVPDYPEDLWGIVRRALARDPAERYATAAELARDLDAFVAARGDEDMTMLTGAILDALFPGEREKRALWLRGVKAQRASMPPSRTSTPPPLPARASSGPSKAPPKPPSKPPPSGAPQARPRSVPKMRAGHK